jgi:hypothetical protein
MSPLVLLASLSVVFLAALLRSGPSEPSRVPVRVRREPAD